MIPWIESLLLFMNVGRIVSMRIMYLRKKTLNNCF